MNEWKLTTDEFYKWCINQRLERANERELRLVYVFANSLIDDVVTKEVADHE